MAPPRLAPGTTFQHRGPRDESGEVRTLTRTEPRRPVSQWHHLRWWRRHHLDRDNTGEWRDESGWGGARRETRAAGGPRRAVGMTRAEQREDLRIAQHAQDLRAEHVASGHREETAAFYGDWRFSAGDRSERRIRVTTHERAQTAYEREEAARYAGRGGAALRRYRSRRPTVAG